MRRIQVDRDLDTHASDLADVVGKRQRIRAGQVAYAQPCRVREVLRVSPEDRPSALVPEKQRRLAEFRDQLMQQPAAAEEPFAGSPRNDPRHSQRVGLTQDVTDGLSVGKAVRGPENEHLQALAAGYLAAGDDEELPLPVLGH